MRVLDADAFRRFWEKRQAAQDEVEVQAAVREIITMVRQSGDEALCRLTARFDGVEIDAKDFLVTQQEIEQAYQEVPADFVLALRKAVQRLRRFHGRVKPASWHDASGAGICGEIWRPLRRVGVYVPGGRAAYPSSVLMNVIPAQEAGVAEIVMCTPPGPNGRVHPAVLVAAAELGVEQVFRLGGAQAVAAMAYGTESVPAVDKIVGPGNKYVAAAKREVFGVVGIDMLAGPSEVVILADKSARPDWVAADLQAQAEHDPDAVAILVAADTDLIARVGEELARQLAELPRREIAQVAWQQAGALVRCADLTEGLELVNWLAPEHLVLAVCEPFALLGQVENAGAVFLGAVPQAAGDYAAGPNHVLPTGGTARYASPLGVWDFLKRSSFVYVGDAGMPDLIAVSAQLASYEGLTGHARALLMRSEGGRADGKDGTDRA
ncbi:MAG: histidinol dehydrogenase [Bacillota bacterium]